MNKQNLTFILNNVIFLILISLLNVLAFFLHADYDYGSFFTLRVELIRIFSVFLAVIIVDFLIAFIYKVYKFNLKKYLLSFVVTIIVMILLTVNRLHL
jgi:hypothetical protein